MWTTGLELNGLFNPHATLQYHEIHDGGDNAFFAAEHLGESEKLGFLFHRGEVHQIQDGSFHEFNLRNTVIRNGGHNSPIHLAREQLPITIANSEVFQQKIIVLLSGLSKVIGVKDCFRIGLETVKEHEVLEHDPEFHKHLILTHISDPVTHGNWMSAGRKGRAQPRHHDDSQGLQGRGL